MRGIHYRTQEALLPTGFMYKMGQLSLLQQTDHSGKTSRTMAGYRIVVIVTAALCALTQLCSANVASVQASSEKNQVAGLSTDPISRKAMLQSSGETSEDGEFSARPDPVVRDLPGTCANIKGDPKQGRDEFLTYIFKQLFTPSPRQEIRKTSARPKLERKRIVIKPIAGNYTQKFSLNVADIQKAAVGIKFWLFDTEKRCLPRSSIKIAVLNKIHEIDAKALKKRYHEFVSGRYFNSNDERWIVFDISAAIARVLRNVRNADKSMDTAKLVIVVKNKCPPSKVNIQNPRQSYMEVTANDRAPRDCTPGEVHCCRQPIVVTSKDLLSTGLGLIVSPRMFNTGYCKGTCEGHSGGSRCCTATKKASLSFLYARNGYIKKAESRHVVECGCR